LSQDRASRFVVAWAFGAKEEEVAPEVVRLTRRRTHAQAGVAWVSDGRKVYAKAVHRVYRDPQRTSKRGRPPLVLRKDVGLTQAVKARVRCRVVGVQMRPVLSEPVACPYCVHGGRLNGVLRDRLNALTRRTHGFAKRTATWDALVVVCLFEHNGIHPHPALRERAEGLPGGRRYRRRTPAMAIGLADHAWSWEEFLTYQYLKE
jgi:IS1 family transposase